MKKQGVNVQATKILSAIIIVPISWYNGSKEARGARLALCTAGLFSTARNWPGPTLQVREMNTEQEKMSEDRSAGHEDGEAIDQALVQMEVLYRCRCVQAPSGSNITVREIKNEE